ncbi:AAA family ATPase [Sorangium sp. So ce726]|uniref:ATP-binding protein n=1 Tax=Sorangium sp. So ce726 TaxID=3133319 RepID=UPI003F643702
MTDRDRAQAGNNLPLMTTRIVGRGETIEHIRRDVIEARLVSIVGPGGIGKTTVALAVAEQVLASFEDGVRLVDFAPLKEPSLVPHAIAAATGLVVHSATIMAALCRFLRDRHTLLVLDNCEHMLDAIAPCVTRILEEAPGVHVLTTGRAPLRAAGEQVHRLTGLAVPSNTSVLTASDALSFPAIELFVERATDRLESFTLSDTDAPAVAEICRSLDGIALAIELAAMRVDVFGVRGLQKQLGDSFHLLGERRAGLERHRTLAATLAWSYGLLPAHEAALLRAVSVFPGAFRLHDASAIANLAPDDVATILAELAAQSLLSADGDARDGMYRLLETTRAYCLEKLVASGHDQPVRLRHAEYLCEIMQGAALELARRPAREWGAAYGRYVDDLRVALSWAGADPARGSLLVRLTTAGTVFWNHFSLTGESCAHLERAIMALPETGAVGTAVEMSLQAALAGAFLYTRGIVPEARAAMGRALEIALQLSDTEYHLRCLRMIGTYELFSGDNQAGMRTLEAFVSMATAADPSALAEGETHLGCAEVFTGRLESARQRLERLYAQGLQDLNDSNSLRFSYNNSINVMIVLSHAQWLTGYPEAAAKSAARVVEYGLKANHELSLSIGLAWVCLVFVWAGRDEECSLYGAMLDDLVERHGIVTWRPIATFCRGVLASRREDTLCEGIADLERTVAECRAMGHMARLPYYMAVLAEALTRQGRLAEAEAMILEALAMAREQKDYCNLPELLRIQASVLAAQGQLEEQEAALLEAMSLAEKFGAASWRLRAANDLARLWQSQARTREATRMLQAVFDTFTEGFGTPDLATARALLDALK